MRKQDCIFCKIVAGEIPCTKVYEDADIFAFLDIAPATIGHTLVITKEHFDNFLYVPKDLLAKAMSVAQKIAQAEVTSLGAKGFNIVINTEKVAGQIVPHFHIHIIPRYTSKDSFQLTYTPKAIEKLNLPQIAQDIEKEL